ncbi:MAG: tRNA (adenosine(37)-N6)-dimethylallyltransferase MiaA [Rickettsiales bacterium]|nr:tRNA (adenosine(37)-N6)-dimethylallyltransferase MiaA [Rickettsiales bacterium]
MKQLSYIITGPTASGKTDFAHAFAKQVFGTIINADSVQVYRGIENLSASPLAEGLQNDGIPYRLYSITEPAAPLSAGTWAKMARAEYDDAIASGRVPIFVGGAGFYLRALLTGFSEIPAVSAENRQRAAAFGFADLQKIDPVWAAKINPNDRQRITRGVEVFLQTGRPLSQWQSAPNVPVLPAPPKVILILPPREIVLQRIATRMTALNKNAEMEVRGIMNLPDNLPIKRADGVAEISKYLRGEIPKDAALELWRRKIERGNAKRQYTWFRTQLKPDAVINNIPTEMDLCSVMQ